MRQITKNAVSAFYRLNSNFNKSNTIVESDSEESKMYLFGNLIAEYNHYLHTLRITNAGWPSITTKERLNGLIGVNIKQRKGNWYLNEKLWDGSWITLENV